VPKKRTPPWIGQRDRRRLVAALGFVLGALVLAALLLAAHYRGSHSERTAPNDFSETVAPTGSVGRTSEGDPNGPEFPNTALTPGAIVTTDTLVICRPGYATIVRPTGDLWRRLKDQAYDRYGLRRGYRSRVLQNGLTESGYEVDHLIPLELGGSPASLENIWPEPIESAKQKDVVENELHDLVCSGRMQLKQAQHAIVKDWKTAAPAESVP
jgi:hypothetical protein